jgi:hypothetical protein
MNQEKFKGLLTMNQDRRQAATARLRTVLAAGCAIGLATAAANIQHVSAAPAATPTVSVACHDVYGPQGLVAAVNAANASGTAQVISLVKGCTYTLTQAQPAICCSGSDNDGLPAVTGRLTILGQGTAQGGGASVVRSNRSGVPTFRLMEVGPSAHLILKGLNLSGGVNSLGGGLYNGHGGVLGVHMSSLTHNVSLLGMGGGLANDGRAFFTNDRVANNLAQAPQGNFGAFGGGIFNNGGNLTMTASMVMNNTALAGTGTRGQAEGGGLSNFGTMTVNTTTVEGNTVEADASFGLAGGAGLQSEPFGTPDITTLNQTTIDHNMARGPAGAMTRGGGVIVDAATLTVNGGAITMNKAGGTDAAGGGIFVSSGAVQLQNGASVAGNTPNNCSPPAAVPGCTG